MPRISLKQYITTTYTGDRKVMARFITTSVLFVIISITLSLTTFAQEDKSVTLVVNGEGKTSDDAKQSALRSAIEQAFGTFISSKTDILNDELIKDEIVSVSNGNIQKFEVLSEGKLPDGGYYNTLKATVSVSKLTSFCESKGISVEFKGALFSFNIKQQKINEENELKAIQDMSVMLKKIIDKSFDFKIDVSSPTSVDGQNNLWKVPVNIGISANDNFFQIPKIIYGTLSGLSLTKKETEDYVNLDKPFFAILLATPEIEDGQIFLLRNKNSIDALYQIIFYFRNPTLNVRISNGINSFSINDVLLNNKGYDYKEFKLNDKLFNPFLFTGTDRGAFKLGSIFYSKSIPKAPGYYFKHNLSGGQEDTDFKIAMRDDRYKFVNDLIEDLESDYGDLELKLTKDKFKSYLGTSIYMIMSLLEIEKNNFKLITINFNDIRSLDEINKITEYKIIPGSNEISDEEVNKNNNQTDSKKHIKFNEKEFVENPDKLPILENQLEFQRNINSQIPEVYKRSGIYEKVNSIVFIDEKGEVQNVQIPKEGKIPICDEIAKTVLMKTKFEPGLLKGVPVKVKMKIPVEFKQ